MENKKMKHWLFITLWIVVFILIGGLVFVLAKYLPQNTIIDLTFITLTPLILLCTTVIAYFSFKKKYPMRKLSVEIFILHWPIIFATFIGMCVYCEGGIKTFGQFWQSLYGALGQLSLQGIREGVTWDNLFICLYPGIAIYCTLTFIIVISSSISYEVLSFLRLIFTSEKKKDVYVFTSLNENTLALAKSIRDNKPKSIIVFSGPALRKFDKHDRYCLEVIKNNFLYWSYLDNGKKSIAEILHINCNNEKDYSRVFSIFAFGIDKDGFPTEEENLEICINDYRIRCSNINKSKKNRIEYVILTKRSINYQTYQQRKEEIEKEGLKLNINLWNEANHVSSSVIEPFIEWENEVNDVNLDFKMWCLGFGETNQSIAGELYIVSSNIDNNGIDNSFNVSSFCCYAFDEKMDKISGLFESNHPLYSVSSPDKIIQYNTNLVERLLDKLENDSKFIEVLSEKKMTFNHFKTYISQRLIRAKNQKIIDESYEDIMSKYLNNLKTTYPNKNEIKINWHKEVKLGTDAYNNLDDIVRREMVFPSFSLNKVLCQSRDFIYKIDHVTGAYTSSHFDAIDSALAYIDGKEEYSELKDILSIVKSQEIKKDLPDVISIATGDDYQNIEIANALIKDILSEKGRFKTRQLIFVKVLDQNNNNLIYTGYEKLINKDKYSYCSFDDYKMRVVIIGNRNRIFSYDTIDYTEAAEYHFYYDKATEKFEKDSKSYIDRYEEYIQKVCGLNKLYGANDNDHLEANINSSAHDFINEDEPSKDGKFEEIAKKWEKLVLWKQISNKAVDRFSKKYYYNYYSSRQNVGNTIIPLVVLEHVRWTRLHIVGGWDYISADIAEANEGLFDKAKYEKLYLHNCIVPECLVKTSTVKYDIFNVLKAIQHWNIIMTQNKKEENNG